ncbi:hypothetical protein XBJ1_2874 [Xenorhabdus bovienii SS-2004]|uniref:Uncharacterized protein n=1 Tax=Xenorhabdus bovienii (strain SS-2004) TaxID=406818 RepID=D3V836_XENBS|nr:hypothetical protein XBJ1_2874 [Xenorhabdus bovienii SS-2004]
MFVFLSAAARSYNGRLWSVSIRNKIRPLGVVKNNSKQKNNWCIFTHQLFFSARILHFTPRNSKSYHTKNSLFFTIPESLME